MQQPILITRPREQGAKAHTERELEVLAQLMDSAFVVPGLGIRFGLDALIGLIPGLGDIITSLVSMYILAAARNAGASRVTLMRMAANIGVDAAVGAIPFAGDMFDVFWKANQKNVALLKRDLRSTPQELRRARVGDGLFVAGLIVAIVAVLVTALSLVWLVIAALVKFVAG